MNKYKNERKIIMFETMSMNKLCQSLNHQNNPKSVLLKNDAINDQKKSSLIICLTPDSKLLDSVCVLMLFFNIEHLLSIQA